jgi:hypothetical protein
MLPTQVNYNYGRESSNSAVADCFCLNRNILTVLVLHSVGASILLLLLQLVLVSTASMSTVDIQPLRNLAHC